MNHFALHLKLTQHCKSIMCGHAYSVVSNSLRPHGLKPTRLLCPWNFPGKNTGVICHLLLQEIFPTQGSKPCLLCLLLWQADSLPLHHLRSLYFNKKINEALASAAHILYWNIQSRLAWLLHKDDTQICETFNIFLNNKNKFN